MSRRKQARPIRVCDSDVGLHPPEVMTHNGEGSLTDSEEEGSRSASRDETVCEHCSAEFPSVQEAEDHRRECGARIKESEDDELDEEEGVSFPEEGKRQEVARLQKQDAENNNSLENGLDEDDDEPPVGYRMGHVTLQALQSTKVAVAQFAAKAMADNPKNATALKEDLAILHSSLYTLQHHQIMQLNLIQQLQHQLQITHPSTPSPSLTPLLPDTRTPTPLPLVASPHTTASQPLPASGPPTPPVTSAPPMPTTPTPVPTPAPSLPPCSVSSAFASSIITNLDPLPSPNEPNTLEMLQKRAEEALDIAKQGFNANNLAEELAFRKSGGKNSSSPFDSKTGGRNEPYFKHRCRYCGKVFGSDSALQIHIRSHTGERPFKCNICGSRFTTKGNLKVHFQRHTSKFPHIKMNPNPVPEHLDKYHPPLLAQMGALSTGHIPHPPPPPHHQFPVSPSFTPTTLSLYRPQHDLSIAAPHQAIGKPVMPLSLFGPRPSLQQYQDRPENLTKPMLSTHSSSSPPIDNSIHFKKELSEEEGPLPPTLNFPEPPASAQTDERLSPQEEPERFSVSPVLYDECSMDSKYSQEPNDVSDGSPRLDDSHQDQPENLSNKSTSNIGHFNFYEQRLPPFLFPNSPPRTTTPVQEFDPSKDPALYTCLLPRPGSSDNSWESLIEITKPSETSKLQQLVDNIGHLQKKPNECMICHRVLSCKSALQMHYRIHTGERPFKCKICRRKFTTKGNLKTHMGVHRIRPPVRVQHQCPVCHKKFHNGLVLQQHIRLHTGEPTDLTPEQIQAAEIRDHPPPSFPQLPPPEEGHVKIEPERSPILEESQFIRNSPSPQLGVPSFSTSLAALENHVRTITTSVASHQSTPQNVTQSKELCSNRTFTHITVNGDKSPQGSPSGSERQLTPSPNPQHPVHLPRPQSTQSCSGASETYALDLTPRTSSSVFSGLGLMPLNPLFASSPFSPMIGHAVRGNTTCNICFKTFACNSALEIHYRSHTKERPYKCTVCERGFSTKGNMKQHMMTHKTHMPCNMYEQKSPPDETSNTSTESREFINMPLALTMEPQPPHPVAPPPQQQPQQLHPALHQPPKEAPPHHNHHQPAPPPQPLKRPQPEDAMMPIPKRHHSLPKHLCHVCNKNFSSSSALQIHMRTHTGDKPFKCPICSKAFTTKGNLKVHMGTHMWSNGASRRGRRMSLELPPLALPPADSDFLPRRHDVFFPYLPGQFLNGMHPKVNDLSIIQNLGSNMSNGMLGFGSYGSSLPSEMKPESPMSEVQPTVSPLHGTTPPMWDPHYERKPPMADDRKDCQSPSSCVPPRSEDMPG